MVILVHQSNSTVKYRKPPLTERSKISNTEEQRLISLSQGSFSPYLLLQLSSRSRKSLHSGLCIQCRLTSADSLLFIKNNTITSKFLYFAMFSQRSCCLLDDFPERERKGEKTIEIQTQLSKYRYFTKYQNNIRGSLSSLRLLTLIIFNRH